MFQNNASASCNRCVPFLIAPGAGLSNEGRGASPESVKAGLLKPQLEAPSALR
jgi:hypothetical protein